MKRYVAILLALLIILTGCRQQEQTDYTDAVVGVWHAVEYEEVVEFRADGTVTDTYCGKTTYGDWILDNENALIWCNFGDDVFSIRISREDSFYILLDNNGTMVRHEQLEEYRKGVRNAECEMQN